ncbi:hypothetical protein C874_03450 [Elizabethkingia anophelis 502]|nr:hypothetical protein C874_03450 [Elizabethkingia anophelis 502]
MKFIIAIVKTGGQDLQHPPATKMVLQTNDDFFTSVFILRSLSDFGGL